MLLSWLWSMSSWIIFISLKKHPYMTGWQRYSCKWGASVCRSLVMLVGGYWHFWCVRKNWYWYVTNYSGKIQHHNCGHSTYISATTYCPTIEKQLYIENNIFCAQFMKSQALIHIWININNCKLKLMHVDKFLMQLGWIQNIQPKQSKSTFCTASKKITRNEPAYFKLGHAQRWPPRINPPHMRLLCASIKQQ